MSDHEGNLVQEYSQNPVNNFPTPGADIIRYEGNALCGDDITIYLCLEDNYIRSCSYDGNCSMITRAGASFLSDIIVGVSIDDVLGWTYNTFAEKGFIVSSRRKRAAVIAILAARNGIHIYRGNGLIDTFDDLIPDY